MPFMPVNILGMWFRGLLAIAIIAGGIYLAKRWYDESHVVVPVGTNAPVEGPVLDDQQVDVEAPAMPPARSVFRFEPGVNRETGYLVAAIALLSLAALGGWALRLASGMFSALKGASVPSVDEPKPDRTGEIHRVTRPDGSELRVECYGPVDAPPVLLTHGWGCDSTEWFYQKKSLASHFRLIIWDEPGLGLSKKPDNNDYRLEKLAADLEAVLQFAGDRPAILVGHSIGGMIILTFCKLFPESLRHRVAGLVLAHTTYKDPVRTTKMAALYTAIERPIIIPMLYVTIAIWPLFYLMNWLSYFNGSAHRSMRKQSFAGTETQGQLDYFASQMPRWRTDVLARGMLGMIHYDATATLPTIPVPTLVVVGDQDITTLPEAGRYMSENIPAAQLTTLSPAKHLGLIEHYSRFNAQLAQFAESCVEAQISK